MKTLRFQSANGFSPNSKIPKFNGSIIRSRHNLLIIELDACNIICVQGTQKFAGIQVPNLEEKFKVIL